MEIFEYDPNKLPERYLRGIGLAISCAAQTESILSLALSGCLGLGTSYHLSLTPHMAIPLKMSALKSAAAFRLNNTQQEELKKLLSNVQDAMSRRNKYAHDSWCQNNEGRVFRELHSARSEVKLERVSSSAEEIEEDARFIYESGLHLMRFLDANDLLPKS